MSDSSLGHAREAARRGKNGSPKRPGEPTRGVRDADGRVVGVLHGHGVTEEDVEAARLLIACMPGAYAAAPVYTATALQSEGGAAVTAWGEGS